MARGAVTATGSASPTSRTESQARTRQRILDAAARLFVSQGFAGTSLEDVAREAGFSKGAVYSNFAGKNDLFFAIVEGQFTELSQRLRDAVDAEADLAGQLAAVGRWYRDYLHMESAWIQSLPEVVAVAAQDPEARQRLSGLLRTVEQAITDLLERQQELMGIRFALPPPTIAALALSTVVGLTVRSLHDNGGAAPDDLFPSAMALLLRPA
jgi:AcrR family transcriptional regulator